MIWSILFGMLGLLLTWWLNRKQSGSPPTQRYLRNTNHLIAQVEKIKAVAVPMGCKPEGEELDLEEDSPQHPLVAALSEEVMEWRPGSIISDKLYQFIVRNYLVPYVRQKWPGMPGTDEELEAFFLKEIHDLPNLKP